MAVIKKVLLFFALIVVSNNVSGQKYEMGVWCGLSAYRGDLNTNKMYNKVFPAGGSVVRYNYDERFSARLGVYYSVLKGGDRYELGQTTDVLDYGPGYSRRWFEVETDMLELSLQAEVNLFSTLFNVNTNRITPYMLFGFGGVYFDPATYEAQEEVVNGVLTVNMKPVKNKHWHPDDNQDYSNVTFLGFLGFGFRGQLNSNVSVGAEWGMRITGTDYLDEVHHKGVPDRNDWYSFTGITLTYVFMPKYTNFGCPY